VDNSSTLFSDDNSAAPASDGSAAISTDDLLSGTDDNSTTTATPDPATDAATATPTGQIGDPLAGASDDSTDGTTDATVPNLGENDDIVPNDTITTNDWSKVGDVKTDEPPAEEPFVPTFTPTPVSEPAPEIQPEPAPTPEVPFASELKYKLPGVDDPEKVAFIKTYTEEFDEAMRRATDAADDILGAIDKAVHEHSPDITIPDAAEEFLSKKPTDKKVEKFEDAREIVNEVLDRAADAKEQAAKAAEEAARIYDEVQAFKQETKHRIADLTAEPQDQLAPTTPLPEPPQISH
jgi:hypothetical protein